MTWLLIVWSLAGAAEPCAEVVSGQLQLGTPIGFATGKAELAHSEAAVAAAVCALQADPALTVQVEVHTDSRGSGGYNQKMSQERADAVRSALLAGGIGAGRVTAVGYGEVYPIESNQTEAGRSTNRRVELHTVPAAERPPRPEPPPPAEAPPAAAPTWCDGFRHQVDAGGPHSWPLSEPLASAVQRLEACLDNGWTIDRDGATIVAHRPGGPAGDQYVTVVTRDGQVAVELTTSP